MGIGERRRQCPQNTVNTPTIPSICSIKGNPSVFQTSFPEMMHPYSGAAHTMRQFLQLLFA